MMQRAWLFVYLLCLFTLPTIAQGAPSQITGALSDLSSRVGREITLTNQTLSNWSWSQESFPDSSLGCPQAGEMAAQVVTVGYVFLLEYGSTVYEYHVSVDGTAVRLCNQVAAGISTDLPLLEQYSNPLCPVPTEQSGAYIRSLVAPQTRVVGTLAVNRLRQSADTQAGILAEVPNGGVFTIVTGPECDDEGIVWWQVDYDGVLGWSAEGQGTERFFVPQPPPALGVLVPLSAESIAPLNLLGRLEGNLLPIFDLTDDGTLVVAGANGLNSLVLYPLNDLANPRLIEQDEQILSLDVSPNNTQVLVGTEAGSVHLWNILAEAPLVEALFLQTHGSRIRAVAVYPDASGFASNGLIAQTNATDNREFASILWDLTSVAQRVVFTGNLSALTALQFAPDGSHLAGLDDAGNLWVWDVTNPTQPAGLPDSRITAMTYSPNGQFLAVADSENRINLIDSLTNTVVTSYTSMNNPVNALVFSPDNALLVAGYESGQIGIWNVQTDAFLVILQGRGAVRDIAFAPDQTAIIVATQALDGQVAIELYGVR